MQEERGACDKRRTAEETLPSHPAHRQGTALLHSNSSSPNTMPKLRKPPSLRRKPQPLPLGISFLKPARQVCKLLLSQGEHNNANKSIQPCPSGAGTLQCSPGSGLSVFLLITRAALLGCVSQARTESSTAGGRELLVHGPAQGPFSGQTCRQVSGWFFGMPQNGLPPSQIAELSRKSSESALGHSGSRACMEKGKPRTTAVLLALPASARGYRPGITISSN